MILEYCIKNDDLGYRAISLVFVPYHHKRGNVVTDYLIPQLLVGRGINN